MLGDLVTYTRVCAVACPIEPLHTHTHMYTSPCTHTHAQTHVLIELFTRGNIASRKCCPYVCVFAPTINYVVTGRSAANQFIFAFLCIRYSACVLHSKLIRNRILLYTQCADIYLSALHSAIEHRQPDHALYDVVTRKSIDL